LWGFFALFLGCFWVFFVAEPVHGEPRDDLGWWLTGHVTQSLCQTFCTEEWCPCHHARPLTNRPFNLGKTEDGPILILFVSFPVPKVLSRTHPQLNLEQVWTGLILNYPNRGNPCLTHSRTRLTAVSTLVRTVDIPCPFYPPRQSIALMAKNKTNPELWNKSRLNFFHFLSKFPC